MYLVIINESHAIHAKLLHDEIISEPLDWVAPSVAVHRIAVNTWSNVELVHLGKDVEVTSV